VNARRSLKNRMRVCANVNLVHCSTCTPLFSLYVIMLATPVKFPLYITWSRCCLRMACTESSAICLAMNACGSLILAFSPSAVAHYFLLRAPPRRWICFPALQFPGLHLRAPLGRLSGQRSRAERLVGVRVRV